MPGGRASRFARSLLSQPEEPRRHSELQQGVPSREVALSSSGRPTMTRTTRPMSRRVFVSSMPIRTWCSRTARRRSSTNAVRRFDTIRRRSATSIPIRECIRGRITPASAIAPSRQQRFWQVLSRARWGSHMFGLMRREALARTKLLLNFAGSDRPMLASLRSGPLSIEPRCALSRFHESASWALNQAELKGFLSTDGEDYSRRKRQLSAFYSSVRSKPVGMTTKATCGLMVSVHVAKVAAQALQRKEARNAAQGSVWRSKQTIRT